jgi:hypothetical protein
VLGIDLHEVARLKLGAASARFPADDVRGIAPKHQ